MLIEKQGVAPKIVRYQYDALGRRIAKHDANDSTWFIWDGLQLLQETRNHALVTYVYVPDSDEALARIEDTINDAHWRPEEQRHNQIFYFHPHINGAPEEMTSSGGQVVWQARYKVWGALLQETDGPYRNPSPEGKDYHPLPQNLRFQGQYFDRETGLHYNTFRYYDPDVGRFTTEDPIGLNGGLNLYQYAPNPFAWIDPWGWVRNPANPNAAQRPNAWREHHTVPQEFLGKSDFVQQMKNAGIKDPKKFIDRQIVRIPAGEHGRVHGRKNRMGTKWNDEFGKWFDKNKKFSKKDLLKQIKKQMRDYGVPKSSRNNKRYGKNGSCIF